MFWFRWRGAFTVPMRLFCFAKERVESGFKLLRGDKVDPPVFGPRAIIGDCARKK